MAAFYGIGFVIAFVFVQMIILAVAVHHRDGFTPWDRRFWR
jgi:hypothetical protein